MTTKHGQSLFLPICSAVWGLLLDKVRISSQQTIFVLKHYFASHNLYWRNILRIELYRMHSVLWNNQIYCNLKVIMLLTETNTVHIMSYAINYNDVIQNFLSDGSILSLADRYCLCLWRFVNLTEIQYACHSQICCTTKLFLMTPLSFKAKEIKKTYVDITRYNKNKKNVRY